MEINALSDHFHRAFGEVDVELVGQLSVFFFKSKHPFYTLRFLFASLASSLLNHLINLSV